MLLPLERSELGRLSMGERISMATVRGYLRDKEKFKRWGVKGLSGPALGHYVTWEKFLSNKKKILAVKGVTPESLGMESW